MILRHAARDRWITNRAPRVGAIPPYADHPELSRLIKGIDQSGQVSLTQDGEHSYTRDRYHSPQETFVHGSPRALKVDQRY